MRDSRTGQAAGETGFALILAILALMLLTMLGLALATMTSSELQIATNYRWSQQALYNAEAGVEAAKGLLRTINWSTALPAARCPNADGTNCTNNISWPGTTNAAAAGGSAVAPFSRADAWGNPTRNFENWSCDQKGFGMGYGVVLDDGSANAPYQYVTTVMGQNISGAFTLWIRRPLYFNPNTQLEDYAGNIVDPTNLDNNMILVSEGVAPFTGGNITSNFGQANRASQVIEVTLSRATTLASGTCGTRGGQVGGGALGAGFTPCDAITGGAGITGSLTGATNLGTGTEINPNQ
jgi:Tfp pilus assembly protein PilX